MAMRLARNLFFLFASFSLAITSVAQPAQAKQGYWKLYERVWVEAPKPRGNPLYPVELTPSGNQATALCRVIDPNKKVSLVVEEYHKWSWTPPPAILVPGERFPMRIEVEVKQTINRVGKYEIGANFDAGFGIPKPTNYDQYRYGGDTQMPGGGRGNLQLGGEFGVHGQGVHVKESFIVVPSKTAWQVPEHPGRISFRAGGNYGFGWNTRYEYVWVEGEPPADRGTTERNGSPANAPVSSPQGSKKDAGGAASGAKSGSNQGTAPTGADSASGYTASVLKLITTKWVGSQANYSKANQDLVFEVGMGSSPRFGYGYAGVELENVRGISAEVLSAPATYAHYDVNSFAGFVIQYATPVGNGKRIMLGTGMLDRKRGDIMFLDAARVYAPPTTEFVDVGVHSNYDFDLSRWAPPNWTGKVVFVIGLQNAGENSVLKVKVKPR